MKKLIATLATVLVMGGCAASADASVYKASAVAMQVVEPAPSIVAQLQTDTNYRKVITRSVNTDRLDKAIANVKSRVHKTWYVFSGATPAGWDCSGLVVWVYDQVGIELEHRASLQQQAGKRVSQPKVGDVVAFTYKGSKSAYHVGIYLGPDKMIHAGGGPGDSTSIVSIKKFAGNYSKVTYTRLIDTN